MPDERESVLLRLRKADAELSLLGDRLRQFRRNHFALVDGVPCLVASNINQRAELETELGELYRTLFRKRQQRAGILAEYSELRARKVTR